MAMITWDDTGKRFYEAGVNHGVLYKAAAGGGYENGVAWNGLTSVSESPDGAEPTDLYADNIKYASLRSAETFGATIEAYTYPEEFAECDGTKEISAGVYVGQQERKAFGLCYRTEIGSDTVAMQGEAYKLHLIYNATASPSEKSYETINDSPDAITFSWEVETTPVPVVVNGTTYKPTSTIVIDSTKVDKTKLQTLEDKLYGSASEEATLPTPAEVIAIFS